MNRLTAARGNYDIIKDSASDIPHTNDFKHSCYGHPGSASALVRDKLLQPEYRHNNGNYCTTLAALLVDRYVSMSLCYFEVCFDGNLKQ